MKCQEKTRFETNEECQKRCNEINSEYDKPLLRVYKCPECKGYHLTSLTKHQHKFYTDKRYRIETKERAFIKRESEYWKKKFGITDE